MSLGGVTLMLVLVISSPSVGPFFFPPASAVQGAANRNAIAIAKIGLRMVVS
jgi:hypothetical protein